MHLVLINQYYPPDEAPTGRMLEAVVERLLAGGHEVTVLCSRGGYTLVADGDVHDGESVETSPDNEALRVVRLGGASGDTSTGRRSVIGKLFEYGGFYLRVGTWLLRRGRNYDRVVALTTPPYLSLLARIGSKFKGADHAHWVMDVYPDVMIAHGMLRDGGLRHRVLSWMARWGMSGQRSASVVTLGPDMAERVTRRLGGLSGPGAGEQKMDSRNTVDWVPLWANQAGKSPNREREDAVSRLRRQRGWHEDETVLMYSGNMGRGHRFEEIFEVMHRWEAEHRERVRFVFYGDGRRRADLETFAEQYPELPIEIHDYASRDMLGEHLSSGDVHLVSLDPAWSGTMLPSKLQGIFSVSRPVIFVGARQSAMAVWVEQSGGGWVVNPGDVDGLATALEEATAIEERQQRGEAAAKYAAEHFDRDRNASRVADLLARS